MKNLLKMPQVVDGGFLFLTGVVALYGFHGTYHGSAYLIAGIVGLLLGLALAEVARQLRQPLVTLLALVVVAFFLLGGVVALHDLGGSNLLPVPHTLKELADSSVHGWKDLLTTLPPVDSGPLLALPYLLGLVSGAVGAAVAQRFRWAAAPALVAVALLVSVILLGIKDPQRTAVTAAVFTVLAITWLVLRERRNRIHVVTGNSQRRVRQVTAVALCLGVAALATVAGPHLPGLRPSHRVVLRSQVVPPFNVGQYASPLAGFRKFTHGYLTVAKNPQDALYDKPLFKVTGLPQGTRVRIAALDSYNGIVWGAGNVADSGSDQSVDGTNTFQKVGEVIDNPARGRKVAGTVTVLDGDAGRPGSSALNVWLPTAGKLTGITFHDPSELVGSDDFRYNLASATGVLPRGLTKGDSYRFTAVLPDDKLGSADGQSVTGGLPDVDASSFQQLATTWGGKAATPLAQVRAVAGYLKSNGHYTDGEKGYQSYLPGESLYRLKQFTSTTAQGGLTGNDEQFAAMMALAANAIGVPTRVVLGAVPEADHIVRGKDVHAWVEMYVDGSWRTMPQSDFMNTTKPQKQQQQDQRSVAASTIPPPAPVHPPASAGQPLDSSLNHRVTAIHDHHFHLPGFVVALLKYVVLPLLIIALICGSIIGAKRWRRTRRRTRGSATRRLAFAWRDLLEHARDHGVVAPGRSTRREQARTLVDSGLGLSNVTASARRADILMFGRQEPSEDAVADYWAEIDRLRGEVSASRTRWQRIRAALNPTSLRPSIALADLRIPQLRRDVVEGSAEG